MAASIDGESVRSLSLSIVGVSLRDLLSLKPLIEDDDGGDSTDDDGGGSNTTDCGGSNTENGDGDEYDFRYDVFMYLSVLQTVKDFRSVSCIHVCYTAQIFSCLSALCDLICDESND